MVAWAVYTFLWVKDKGIYHVWAKGEGAGEHVDLLRASEVSWWASLIELVMEID